MHLIQTMTPITISLLLALLPTTIAYCMDTGDETCCYCNDSWLCGVTLCPLTTTVTQRTTTSTMESSTTTTTSITVTDNHSVTMSTTTTTVTITPRPEQSGFSTLAIVGFAITGTFGLGAMLWIFHCLFWYVARCFDSREQPTCRTELLNLLSTPLARFSDLNVSESTV